MDSSRRIKKSPYAEHKGRDTIIWSQVFGHTESESPHYWVDTKGEFWGIDCIYKHYLIEELDNDRKLIERKLRNVVS